MSGSDPYGPIFDEAGKEWNVDPNLLRAIAAQETGGAGDPNKAVSPADAQGLMQIIPETQKYLGITDPTDPVQSIYGGAKYLSEALDAEKTPEGALLYYHGGPDWRNHYGPESQTYVPGVTAHYKQLTAASGAVKPPQPAVVPGVLPVASTPKQPAADATDDFLSGKVTAPTPAPDAPSGTPAAAAPDATDDFLSGKGAVAPTAQVTAPPESTWRGLFRNAAAGLTDAGANVINFLSDPVGNLAKVPVTAAVWTHDALAPAIGYAPFDDNTRHMLLDDNVAQPGTKLVANAGNLLGVDPSAVPATDAERMVRKAVGAAGTVATLGPGGVVAPVAAATGAVAGDVAGQVAPEWSKPAAEMAGNLFGASLAAAGGSVGRSLTGSAGGAAPPIADLAKVARDKYQIPITAPQLSENSLVRIANEQSAKLPFSGAGNVAAAQDAAWHVALGKEMGETGTTAFTPQVMASAAKRIGDGMNDIANRTNIDVANDPQLINDLDAIQKEVHSGQVPLAPGGAASVDANIDGIIKAATHGNGIISGDVYQKMTQTNSPLDRASSAGDAHTQNYNQQIMDALDRAFERSASPDDKTALAQLRGQYRVMKTVEPLAAKSPDGTINPADLMTRVTAQSRRFDGSTSGVAYTGGGNLGELARIGKQFMGKQPNSGTPDRLLVNGLALGGFGGAGVAAAGLNPLALVGIPAGLTANRLAGMYLRGGGLANRMINSSITPSVNTAVVPPSLVLPALAPPNKQSLLSPP